MNDIIDQMIADARSRQSDPLADWERAVIPADEVPEFRGQPGVFGRPSRGDRIQIVPRDWLGVVEAVRRGVLPLSAISQAERDRIESAWGFPLKEGPPPIIGAVVRVYAPPRRCRP